VVTKDIQKDLKKYKNTIGKTPSKEKRGQLSAEKASPARRLHFSQNAGASSPDRAASEDRTHDSGNTKEVRELLKEID